MKPLILAVDFDGTIIKNEKDYVPRTLMPNAKEVIEWAHKKGCYIIIWTCRSGEMLQQMSEFLKSNKIVYDMINDNYPQVGFVTSRKIFSDFYIDDRSFDINWMEIKHMISKKMIAKMAEEIEELSEEMQLKKAATDPQVKKAIELIWKEYKANRLDAEQFSRKVGEVLKRFGMTWFTDKNWLDKFLQLLTKEQWKLTPEDFSQARV
jgi:hydroxymethylpyrimidine pyrophosphatase-like HAD family hydrolase